jgi:hypothetical protein
VSCFCGCCPVTRASHVAAGIPTERAIPLRYDSLDRISESASDIVTAAAHSWALAVPGPTTSQIL